MGGNFECSLIQKWTLNFSLGIFWVWITTHGHAHTHIVMSRGAGGWLGFHVLGSEWWSPGKWKINGYSGYISLLHLYTSPPDPSLLPSAKWNRRHLGSLILFFWRLGVGCVCLCVWVCVSLYLCVYCCMSMCVSW